MNWKLWLLLSACMIALLTMIIEAAAVYQGDRTTEGKRTDYSAEAESDANSGERMKRAMRMQ